MGSDAVLGALVRGAVRGPRSAGRGSVTGVRRVFIALAVAMSTAAGGPLLAQVDMSGWWANKNHMDNNYAEEPVDFLGIPLSADGRAKALSYNIAALSVTERQCQMYTPFYALTGPFGLQITSEPDAVTQKLLAWRIAGWIDRDVTTIWMDGRPRPPAIAPHTHGGFTTGTWEGDTLKAVVTHFKMGDIKRHRGFSSDKATITLYMTRFGDVLSVTGVLEDPVYLAEPYVMTVPYRLDPNANLLALTACEPIEELPYLHENRALVPHYLPDRNPFVNELTEKHHIPLEATMGGPETMYPEFRKKIRAQYTLPPPCTSGCGGPPPAPAAGRGAAPAR